MVYLSLVVEDFHPAHEHEDPEVPHQVEDTHHRLPDFQVDLVELDQQRQCQHHPHDSALAHHLSAHCTQQPVFV